MLSLWILTASLATAPVSTPAATGGPSPFPTETVRGACIVPSGQCKVVTPKRCRKVVGTYLGHGVRCPASTRPAVTS